jgi:hypothetical protein
MIFNEDMIFIHIGKTGGMSCSHYLLHNLRGQVHNCHQTAADELKKLGLGNKGIVSLDGIHRHCTLRESLDFIHAYNGSTLESFEKIVAVVRHPFSLEFSYYNHLKKPAVRKLRSKNTDLVKLADGSFESFIKESGYHRPNHPQEAFFLLNNEMPDNLELIKFEQIQTNFPASVENFLSPDASYSFPARNKTDYKEQLRDFLSDEVKEQLYQKHRYMFDSGLYSVDEY